MMTVRNMFVSFWKKHDDTCENPCEFLKNFHYNNLNIFPLSATYSI